MFESRTQGQRLADDPSGRATRNRISPSRWKRASEDVGPKLELGAKAMKTAGKICFSGGAFSANSSR